MNLEQLTQDGWREYQSRSCDRLFTKLYPSKHACEHNDHVGIIVAIRCYHSIGINPGSLTINVRGGVSGVNFDIDSFNFFDIESALKTIPALIAAWEAACEVTIKAITS